MFCRGTTSPNDDFHLAKKSTGMRRLDAHSLDYDMSASLEIDKGCVDEYGLS